MLAKRDEGTDALRTPRLALMPFAPHHAPALHPLMDDWEVVRMLAMVPWPLSLEDVAAYAREHSEGRTGSDEFAILLGGEPIGVCSVKRPGSSDPPRVMPRLGYWIGRPFWAQGYATEAIAALVAFAFQRHPQDRIGAGVFVDNPASRRMLEKHGFAEAGRYPVACRARGEEVETLDMILSRAAWEKARA